jgi:flavodoxin
MKIAIVLHSQSGHTAQFAKIIASKFTENGHETDTRLLRTSGHVSPGKKNFELRDAPEIDQYDAALFGGPVWAFTASPVIMKYLSGLKNFKGKKAACFVTMGSPFLWMGGNQAVKAMNSKLESCGADVLKGEIVPYHFKANKTKMTESANRLYKTITG